MTKPDDDAHSAGSPISAKGILAGFVGATILGVLIGILAALAQWPRPLGIDGEPAGFFWMLWSGIVVGAAASILVAGVLAWHGASLAAQAAGSELAPVWGVITGIVLGMSLAPVLGALAGLFVGQTVAGLVFGLYAGPLVGIAAWEGGYLGSRMLG